MKINIFSILTFFCAITLIGISGSEAFGQDVNLALKENNPKVTAAQSSFNVWTEANQDGSNTKKAIDGIIKSGQLKDVAEIKDGEKNAWIEVNLGANYKINKIVIHARENCSWCSFKSTYLIITDQAIGVKAADESELVRLGTSSQTFDFPSVSKEIETNGSVGQFVRLQLKDLGSLSLAEIEIFGNPTPVANVPTSGNAAVNTTVGAAASQSGDPRNLARNAAVGATASQSSTFAWGDSDGKAQNAIDGKFEKIAETNPPGKKPNEDANAWFELDLKNYYKIDKIVIHPRTAKDCCEDQFHSTWLIVTDQPLPVNEAKRAMPMIDEARIGISSTYAQYFENRINQKIEIDLKGVVGQYIRLQTKGARIELKEIEVFGDPAPVAYTSNPDKKWDAAIKMAFDPGKPYFLGIDPGVNPAYWGTLHGSPKIVVAKNSATSFDVAYQDLYGTGKKIRINTYEKNGTGFKRNAAESTEADGLGTFAGFTKDAGKNRYVFTSEAWKGYTDLVKAEVVKIPVKGSPEVIWDAKYFEPNTPSPTTGVKSLMNGFYEGTSRLVAANNSLLITTNIYPTHPYQVILDTQDKTKNTNRAFFESLYQHNFGQRAIFDGSDFVIMENRDHDVSVTLTKFSPEKVLPLMDETITAEQRAKLTDKDKWEGHPSQLAKKRFSVYSHTNFGNNTYTELGNIEKGFGDNGYLVLFSGERDWNYKTNGYNFANGAPNIFSPRDIGLVHVKKDFDKTTPNWGDNDGNFSMCPAKVDNSSVVNSTGEKTIIKYRVSEDGWDWAKTYNAEGPCKTTLGSDRVLETKGVKWVTNYGAPFIEFHSL